MNRRIATTLSIVAAAGAMTVAAGCGSSSSADVPTAAEMKGTWTFSARGFEGGRPVSQTGTINVNTVDGPGFGGYEVWKSATGESGRLPINGVISPNGDVLITDTYAEITGTLSGGTFSGQYAETGPDGAALNVTGTKN